jgi:hypothetical protein
MHGGARSGHALSGTRTRIGRHIRVQRQAGAGAGWHRQLPRPPRRDRGHPGRRRPRRPGSSRARTGPAHRSRPPRRGGHHRWRRTRCGGPVLGPLGRLPSQPAGRARPDRPQPGRAAPSRAREPGDRRGRNRSAAGQLGGAPVGAPRHSHCSGATAALPGVRVGPDVPDLVGRQIRIEICDGRGNHPRVSAVLGMAIDRRHPAVTIASRLQGIRSRYRTLLPCISSRPRSVPALEPR